MSPRLTIGLPRIEATLPPKPKRPTSAFLYFTSRGPKFEPSPVYRTGEKINSAKEMGARWNRMSVEEKAPYTQQAERDLARYHRETKAHLKEAPPGSLPCLPPLSTATPCQHMPPSA